MNIAIIEDNPLNATHLQELLDQWGEIHTLLLHTSSYISAEHFIKENEKKFDIIFMDIDLPGISGIDIARQLREKSYKGHIIFLTAYNEYVFDGYHVRALDYLIKPITSNLLEDTLRPVLLEFESSYYILRTSKSIQKIRFSTIIAFASQGHYIDIITSDDLYKQKISIKLIKQMLPEEFVQCHRTAIININHVTKIDGCNLYLSNQTCLPISKKYLSEIQEAFLNCSI